MTEVSIAQVAEITGYDRHTIARWAKDGGPYEMPAPTRRGLRRQWFSESAIPSWAEKLPERPEPEPDVVDYTQGGCGPPMSVWARKPQAVRTAASQDYDFGLDDGGTSLMPNLMLGRRDDRPPTTNPAAVGQLGREGHARQPASLNSKPQGRFGDKVRMPPPTHSARYNSGAPHLQAREQQAAEVRQAVSQQNRALGWTPR